jgi:hypothetical protein
MGILPPSIAKQDSGQGICDSGTLEHPQLATVTDHTRVRANRGRPLPAPSIEETVHLRDKPNKLEASLLQHAA